MIFENYSAYAVVRRQDHVGIVHMSAINYFKPLFDFIDEAIKNGDNVLIHCLAGAHRAGTVGIACLMHYAEL